MLTNLSEAKGNIPELNQTSHTHEFAYDENKTKVKIEDASKGIKYTDINGIPLQYKSGQYRTYFSYLQDMTNSERTKAMESCTYHDDIIKQIFFSEAPFEFTVELSDGVARTLCLNPHKRVMEKATLKHLGLDRIPDLTFYNENGEIDCLIEVVVTHQSEESKIEQLYNTGILTIEIYYDKENDKTHEIFGAKPIRIFGDKWFEDRYSEFRFDASKSARRYFAATEEAERIERDIRTTEFDIRRIGDRISEIKGRISYAKESADKIRETIKRIGYGTVSGADKLKENIELLRISDENKRRTLEKLTPQVVTQSISTSEFIRIVKEETGLDLT